MSLLRTSVKQTLTNAMLCHIHQQHVSKQQYQHLNPTSISCAAGNVAFSPLLSITPLRSLPFRLSFQGCGSGLYIESLLARASVHRVAQPAIAQPGLPVLASSLSLAFRT